MRRQNDQSNSAVPHAVHNIVGDYGAQHKVSLMQTEVVLLRPFLQLRLQLVDHPVSVGNTGKYSK
jgi:hypothetical protein